jgi:hypothetical protein
MMGQEIKRLLGKTLLQDHVSSLPRNMISKPKESLTMEEEILQMLLGSK